MTAEDKTRPESDISLRDAIRGIVAVCDAGSELRAIQRRLVFPHKLKSLRPKWFKVNAAAAGRANPVVSVVPTQRLGEHLSALKAFGGRHDDAV